MSAFKGSIFVSEAGAPTGDGVMRKSLPYWSQAISRFLGSTVMLTHEPSPSRSTLWTSSTLKPAATLSASTGEFFGAGPETALAFDAGLLLALAFETGGT